MPIPDQVKVYKPTGIFYVAPVIANVVFGAIAIGVLADFRHTGWSGVVLGVLIIAVIVLMVTMAATTSVTIHSQGVVIRQNLRRRFIPWEAVATISRMVKGRSVTPIVGLVIPTGVKYMEKTERLQATAGSEHRVKAIVAEMQEFQRRERETRLASGGNAEPCCTVRPARPPGHDDPSDDSPAWGRGVP